MADPTYTDPVDTPAPTQDLEPVVERAESDDLPEHPPIPVRVVSSVGRRTRCFLRTASYQLTASNTKERVLPANGRRTSALLKCTGATVYVREASGVSATDFPLNPGDVLTLATTEDVWVTSNGATATVYVLQEFTSES